MDYAITGFAPFLYPFVIFPYSNKVLLDSLLLILLMIISNPTPNFFFSPYIFSKKWSVCKEGKGVMISNAVSFFGDNRFYFGHRYRNETIIKVEQVYHLVAFLFNLSSPLLQLSAYCKEMQKHTCHFPAIEQRNYARAWPPGQVSSECSPAWTLGDKNLIYEDISNPKSIHSREFLGIAVISTFQQQAQN